MGSADKPLKSTWRVLQTCNRGTKDQDTMKGGTSLRQAWQAEAVRTRERERERERERNKPTSAAEKREGGRGSERKELPLTNLNDATDGREESGHRQEENDAHATLNSNLVVAQAQEDEAEYHAGSDDLEKGEGRCTTPKKRERERERK